MPLRDSHARSLARSWAEGAVHLPRVFSSSSEARAGFGRDVFPVRARFSPACICTLDKRRLTRIDIVRSPLRPRNIPIWLPGRIIMLMSSLIYRRQCLERRKNAMKDDLFFFFLFLLVSQNVWKSRKNNQILQLAICKLLPADFLQNAFLVEYKQIVSVAIVLSLNFIVY